MCIYPNIIKFLIQIFFILFVQQVIGQNSLVQPLSFHTGFYFGKIIPHNLLFKPKITEPSYLFEIGLNRRTSGSKIWHKLYNCPTLGISGIYAHYGDSHIFGQAVGVLPSITFAKWQHTRLYTAFRMGVGMAYITKPYNKATNPINNVIGAHIDNITQFMYSINYNINPNFALQGQVSFTHFSDGKVKLPNLGINIPAVSVGLKYNFEPQLQNPLLQAQALHDSLPTPYKKIKFNMRLGLGFTEMSAPNGPRYNVYDATVYFSKRLNIKSEIYSGVETNYYTGIYRYIINQVAYIGNEHRYAFKVSPVVGYSLFFGRASFLAQVGYYIYDPFFKSEPVNTKLGLQLYAKPTYLNKGFNAWVGMYLKSHYTRADMVELAVGVSF